MPSVPPAPLAVLAQGDAVRVVALGLLGLVVPALALLAGEGDGDPDISAGHGSSSEVGLQWHRAEKNPAPVRGRTLRIAQSRASHATPREHVRHGAEQELDVAPER